MKTYQELVANNSDPEFVISAIEDYQGSNLYHWALEGEAYSEWKNTTIMLYQKILYKVTGEAIPDKISPNHKCASNFFDIFNTQEVQYLLGNGVTFNNSSLKKKLGTKTKKFDDQLVDIAKKALIAGVAYGFFNLDHVDVFSAKEFVPFYDEETGALRAGIRFWQIRKDMPLRATLYEEDGITEIIRKNGTTSVYVPKRPYKFKTKHTEVDGTEFYDGANYPSFPIVPLWGNKKRQSQLIGLKQSIDCYDLIKSGCANDLDEASMIYWTLENCGGMDDIDLAEFKERLMTLKAAVVDGDGGARAEAHTLDVPYAGREAYLNRLENDMYRDAQALNVNSIASGNVTATAIRAAYQRLDDKCDEFEYCLNQFIQGILALIGVDDDPAYKRNRLANETEETTMVIAAAQYLDDETILKHLPFLSPDEIPFILKNREKEEIDRVVDKPVNDNGGDDNVGGQLD